MKQFIRRRKMGVEIYLLGVMITLIVAVIAGVIGWFMA